MPSLPPSKPKSEPIGCTPESIPSTIELEDEEYISLQGACSGEGAKRRKVLPKSIVEEGGIFTTVCLFKVKRGQGDKVVEQFKKVHKETDEMELSVYSHRVMRGFGDDEDQIAVVIEYDNAEAFYTHFQNTAFQALINSPDFLTNRPKLSFFRELDS